MMTYKGYVGVSEVDDEAGVIRGRVVNTRDTITFQGKTVEAARAAFCQSVNDYLKFCAELGEEPDKPFSGKILLRVPPDLHRQLSIVAQVEGLSVNRLVSRAIKRVVRTAARTSPAVEVLGAKTGPSKRKPAVREVTKKAANQTALKVVRSKTAVPKPKTG